MAGCADLNGNLFTGSGGDRYQATVQSFHRLTTSTSRTYAFAPTKTQEQDLEYLSYQDQFRERLTKLGWREAQAAEAELTVTFDFYIDNGQVRTYEIPVFGQTGVSGSWTTGQVSSYGGFSGTTTYTPSFGVTGYRSVSETYFTRRLMVVMFGRTSPGERPVPVYQGSAVSLGSTGYLSPLMPFMLSAIFSEFPGENGRVNKYHSR